MVRTTLFKLLGQRSLRPLFCGQARGVASGVTKNGANGLAKGVASALARNVTSVLASGAALGLLALSGQPVQARLSSLSNLYVFGDSLADSGNSGLLTQAYPGAGPFPPPPYFGGRMSNGPMSTEYLWNLFNPSTPGPIPSLAGGTNYAINGATSGLINYNAFGPTVPANVKPAFTNLGAASQLGSFVAQNPSFDPSRSLFVVWFFPNDVLYWLGTSQAGSGLNSGTVLGGNPAVIGNGPAAVPALVQNGITNIGTMITALAGRGASQFLVPNMPDLGKTPVFRNNPNPAIPASLSAISTAFNSNLDPALQQLQASLAGTEIVRFQTDDLLAAVLADPASYGFDNVSDACLNRNLGTICANPDRWLFWDDFHPSTAGQRLIGQAFYGATLAPSPGPLPLAGGIGGLLWSRRLRRRIRAGEAGRG
jgi:phospholipase/lecithinase/hemolysin